MKKLFTLILSLAIFGIAFSQTNVSGNISSNTTWNLAGSPYIVTANLTVDATFTLTINSGVEVKFDNGRSLSAYGDVNATSATFTSNDGSPIPGIWGILYFYSGTNSTFTNCAIEYGQYIDVKDGGSYTMTGGSIENMYYYGILTNGTVNVSNAIIDLTGYVSTGHGIHTRASSVTSISNTSILNCNNGVYVSTDGSQVTINSSTLSSNTYPLYFGSTGDLTVTGTNTFTGNTYDVFYVYHNAMGSNWSLPYVSVPYYFRTSFSVNNGTTLTIADENILKFSSVLYVRGTLSANASGGQNIYFTSYRDDNWGGDSNGDGTATAPAVSNWTGITFYDESSDASVMRRCMVRYASNGINLQNAGPTIDLCDFSQNYHGAYFQYASNPTFTNNTIGSSSLTPIAMSFEANPTFTNNVLSFSDNQYDAIGLIGGTLTADAHIIQRDFTTVNNITYYMLSTIIVPPAYTLTIDPGIVIKSSSYSYRMQIQGKLIADGTPADRIVLTSVKDDNFGNPGDTNKDGTISTPNTNDISAIIFENGYDPTSIVDNVTIKYASVYNYYYSNGGQNHYVHAGAIITLNQTTPAPAGPTISNCEIRESAYGISSYQSSNPIVSNNSFINITSTPLSMAGTANPTYTGNTYTNCGVNALGLIGQNVVVNGTISKRNVAGYNNITYVLLESITVKNGTNLDIDPGVVVKMLSKSWTINGGFKINGTVSEHVLFTSLYDDNVGNPMDTNGDGNATAPNRGNWSSITFNETSDDAYCVLDYADLQYCSNVIYTTNSSPTITNTLIDQSSGYGVYCAGISAPVFNNVDIQNCSGDPIAMSLTSNPSFSNITFAANGSNGIFILEGTLSANATLNKRNIAGFTNIAYIISQLSISTGSTLTLEAGIVIKIRGSYYYNRINVHGGLSSIGTSSQKIIFTSFADDSAGGDTNNDGNSSGPGSSDWNGILYYPEGDDAVNKLIYSEIRYAGGTYYTFGDGSVQVKDAYVQIDHVVFQQGTSGIGIYGSANPSITNCEIYNFTSYPIHMAMFSNPTFSGNTLANIKYTAIGIQNETYSQTATFPTRNFAGYNDITYMLSSTTINSGTTITIPAGMVLKGGSFTVNGKLEIDGTSGNPVIFTDFRDDDYGNPADTEQNGSGSTPGGGGAHFNFSDVSDDASYIDHALIRYTSNPIYLSSASPTISNNTFDQISSYGIRNLGVCAPHITNNTFNDLTLAPIQISLVSFPATLTGNTITGTTYKGIAVNVETLTQDITLPKRSFASISNIPYIFSGYTIGTGVTLTIDPGVICKFTTGYMYVNNGLIAEGLSTSGNRIVFTSITDDFYGGDTNADEDATAHDYSRWAGIRINDVALDPLTRFEHCIFRNVSGQGAIYTTSASPSILNCSFNNCYGGVYATASSNPTINYCDFRYMHSSYKAVDNVNQSFVIDATNCWWGDNSGPTHTGNPGGTGEKVSDGVNYTPYGTSGAMNPLLGDVSLNSIIQAYDASLILQHVAGPPILNPTQQGVADVSGNGSILAYDASLILQYAVGLINYFPASLLNPMPAPVSDVELMLGNVDVEMEEEFALPISINNVSDLYAMEMSISYDPGILEAIDVENLISEMNINFSIDNLTGTVTIALAGIESLEYAMDAANIIFKVNEGVTGITTPVSAKYFMGNETDLSWNVGDGSVSINGFATGLGNDFEDEKTQLSCYPNPFSNQLNINYQIAESKQNVAILVYDIYGQLVAEIANGAHDAATYKISWNGNDQHGVKLTNGTYFIRMISQDKVVTQKIQIVR